jgi:hypothetical protein
MVADIAPGVLEKIGNDQNARYAFIKRFVELAELTVWNAGGPPDGSLQ